jgi:Arc/MetJ-type ribon-helix-helix transcriptional regulator
MDGKEMVGGWLGVTVKDREDHYQPRTGGPRQIDLLVQEGFYANRTDFIRTQLATLGEALDQTAARRTLTLGSCQYTGRDLEEIRDTGQLAHIRVLGLASIAADVSPQLALATIASVEVLGTFRAPAAVKAALAPRTT